MARDFNPDWVEIEAGCFGPDGSGKDCGCIHLSSDAEAAAKKRVLDELRKFGLHFTETPYLQVDPASAERALCALRLQAANPGMTYSEASRQVRAEKQAG